MINKKCDCAKKEKYGLDGKELMAQHIRYGPDFDKDPSQMAQRIRYGDPNAPGYIDGVSGMAQHIRRSAAGEYDGMAQRIRYGTDEHMTAMAQHVNMNNDFQGRLKNHIRRDSKMEMISNLMTGSK